MITLEDFSPEPRYPPDTAVWVRARIERGPTAGGPWTVAEPEFVLYPPVTDPADPPTYGFTSDAADLADGEWVRVVWVDADNFEQPTVAVQNTAAPYRPSVRQIASILRVRPKTVGGDTLDTFTADTTPTASQVEEYIDNAASEVLAETGATIPPAVTAFAMWTIAIRAGQFVELGYPEVLGTARTAFAELETMFTDRMPKLLAAVNEAGGDTADPGGAGLAYWGFPVEAEGFITGLEA